MRDKHIVKQFFVRVAFDESRQPQLQVDKHTAENTFATHVAKLSSLC